MIDDYDDESDEEDDIDVDKGDDYNNNKDGGYQW